MLKHDPDPMLDFLNEIIRLDEPALRELIAHRVICNAALAEHESVQVGLDENPGDSLPKANFRVGFLGLLNGYFGTLDDGTHAGYGPITAIIDDDAGGRILRFERTV